MQTVAVQFVRPYRGHSAGSVRQFASGLARELIRVGLAREPDGDGENDKPAKKGKKTKRK